ncbi:MAG: ABC transporter substrate-binding protein [Deltaproteobacteria bacterium]|nr:ABC transporter substrate-binding protein [Deltaproteobacteria bacterium]
MRLFFSTWLALSSFLAAWPAPGLQAADEPRPWRLLSWASPIGPQSLAFESLEGLKAMTAFLNANGGLDGRRLELRHLDLDDGQPDFQARLAALVEQVRPDLIVGGVSDVQAGRTADFFRRLATPWFGPWSGSSGPYRGLPDDPIGLMPTAEQQLELLFDLVLSRLGPGAEICFFVSPSSQTTVAAAAQAAATRGLVLEVVEVAAGFNDWASLAQPATGRGAVVLWIPPGPAAAVLRTLKPKLSGETLWLANAMLPPCQELDGLTGGTWAGVIFPATLAPKTPDLRPYDAYDAVLRKYGPPGLSQDYQSYLGLAQGQILARVLQATAKADGGRLGDALRAGFQAVAAEGTLLTASGFAVGLPPDGSFYLAQALRRWEWRPLAPQP